MGLGRLVTDAQRSLPENSMFGVSCEIESSECEENLRLDACAISARVIAGCLVKETAKSRDAVD